mgnify:CR=1 FL=1
MVKCFRCIAKKGHIGSVHIRFTRIVKPGTLKGKTYHCLIPYDRVVKADDWDFQQIKSKWNVKDGTFEEVPCPKGIVERVELKEVKSSTERPNRP